MDREDAAVAARPTLTEAEWLSLDAIRSGVDIDVAATAAGVDEPTFRRTLAMAAEKLRIVSSLAVRTPATADVTSSGRMHIPHMSPCPFCENFAGRFSERSGPPAVINEDENVYVFLAPAPLGGLPGHTLVTSRRHVETIFDLTAQEEAALGAAVARSARMIRAALDPAGLLVQQNNGAAAFQTVPHIHFHVIPKMPGPFPPAEPPQLIPAAERAVLADQMRKHW